MSSFKGILGETAINVAMWIKLDKDIYHRLNNITLPLDNGGSTQIDHVIVSKYGIFVIETKNYKGWIFGNEKQKQWTQVIMGRKYKFQNPLRQNYLHIKTLAELLELEMSYFHSMIAFIGECELKTRDELPEHVLTSGMASYVKKKQAQILTEDEVKMIVEQIENNRFTKSWRTNREHKDYLRDKHNNESKKSVAKPTAPSKPKAELESSSQRQPTPKFRAKAKEVIKIREVQSSEVQGWSGQTELANEPFVVSTEEKPETFYITPFAFDNVESKPLVKTKADEPIIDESIKQAMASNSIISNSIPSCPKCQSEMIKRVAKKGMRQGQSFYGCSQFPKCRGVINNVEAC